MTTKDWFSLKFSRIAYALLLFVFGMAPRAHAFELYRQINATLRTYPFSASVRAQGKLERVVWDQRKESAQSWRFGVFQAGLNLASHGLIEGQASFAPISFVEVGFSTSKTLRFYETSGFNCDLVFCKGDLDRDTIWYRGLIGQEFSTYSVFFVPMLSITDVQLSKSNPNFATVADEVDRVQFNSSGDELKAETFVLGLKAGIHSALLVQRQARYQKSKDYNRSRYFILSEESHDKVYSLGLGQFVSRDQREDWSVITSFSWRPDGKTQGLF